MCEICDNPNRHDLLLALLDALSGDDDQFIAEAVAAFVDSLMEHVSTTVDINDTPEIPFA